MKKMRNESLQLVKCENSDAKFQKITESIAILSGKWTLTILWILWESPLRFGELHRKIPNITQHMLTTSLRKLEKEKLIKRKVFPEVPPKVEYSLTEKGKSLQPIFAEIINWSLKS